MKIFGCSSRDLERVFSGRPVLLPPPLPRRGKADFPLEERLGSEREGRKREKIKTRARKVQKQQFELTALSLSLSQSLSVHKVSSKRELRCEIGERTDKRSDGGNSCSLPRDAREGRREIKKREKK